jgi:hypothetical protein
MGYSPARIQFSIETVRQLFSRILIVFLLPAGTSHANPDFDLVNRLRSQAGLPLLVQDETLSEAAQLHAAYLDRYREPGARGQGMSAHAERPGRKGFSGETPAARALAAGYPHREVLENVSMGYADAEAAMLGLMSAIYHRLTFLDLESDRMGVAVGKRSRVFLLGRDDMVRLCQSPPAAALSRTPVDCLGQAMTREYYEALCADLPEKARFRSSHPVSCTNGTLLDAEFMAAVCREPPRPARFRGHGRYYAPCENGTRLDARWFNALCQDPPQAAAYPFSGSYYEICEAPVRVHAEWLEAQCSALPATARYSDSGRYRRPCADESDIRVEYLDGLDAAKQQKLPEVVVWPPAGAGGVPPAFFIEEPDPLPDLDVAGYPLSIQFNPARARQVSLQGFALYRLDGESREPVELVRLLDHANDPNRLLSTHEFALFPLQRLAWGTDYVAVVEASVDGLARRFEWKFETSGRDLPLLTATARTQRFAVRSGLDYLLYLPPKEASAYTVLSTRTEHLRGNSVELEVVDPNTLRVRVDLRYCDRVRIQFDDGRLVELLAQGCPG